MVQRLQVKYQIMKERAVSRETIDTILRGPTHGRMDQGRPSKSVVNTLVEDSGTASTSEISNNERESCLV